MRKHVTHTYKYGTATVVGSTCDKCGSASVVSFSRGLCYCEPCDSKRDAYERKVQLMHELIRTMGVK